MKIAVPCNGKSIDNEISPSFGRCPFYIIVDSETLKYDVLVNNAADSHGGAGIKAAQLIVDSGADVVITLRCGQNAANVLKLAGIKILKATQDTVRNLVSKFNEGDLEELRDIHPGFHGGF